MKRHKHTPSPPSHDFSRIPVYPAGTETAPAEAHANRRSSLQVARWPGLKSFSPPTLSPVAEPFSNGSLDRPEEPPGEFNEEGAESGEPSAPAVAEAETPQNGAEMMPAPQPQAEPTPAPQPQQAAPATRTVIRGPREMWNFDGETPANYTVSSRLSTNRTGGTFRWSVSANLTLSAAGAATPTVTTAAPSAAARDAWIAVRHTDAAGVATRASYRLTILAPDSLTHLRNVDNADATFGYLTEIHYSIGDQFGTTLPRDVPLHEQWAGPVVADFAGMNWPRGPEGSATVNPADWHDLVGGVGAGGSPAPVGPTHADAAVAIEHWPGDWRVGSLTIGSGRRVSSVTWQRNRGFARHT